jgi:hypothetical protein
MKSSRPWSCAIAAFLALFVGATVTTRAQITNGTVSGSVRDASGAVIPGATVTLTSATRGTSQELVTSPREISSSTPMDTYIVKVCWLVSNAGRTPTDGARRRQDLWGVSPSRWGRSKRPSRCPGTRRSSRRRAVSGRLRSERVSQAIAQNGRNFNTFTALAPGFCRRHGQRHARQSEHGPDRRVTSMDTGNNGSAVTLTVDAVQKSRC